MQTATTAQMREIDRIAIEEYGIPSLELMETAAGYVAKAVEDYFEGKTDKHIVLMCGTGNNGGDGLACARLLRDRGYEISLYLVGDEAKCTPDSKANIARLKAPYKVYRGEAVPACDAIVDALFGVGLNRNLEGLYKSAVERINECPAWTVSCDIPSGINGDTGAVCGVAVKAAKTITFSCMKPGLLTEPGRQYAGQTVVADIGIPREVIDKMLLKEV